MQFSELGRKRGSNSMRYGIKDKALLELRQEMTKQFSELGNTK